MPSTAVVSGSHSVVLGYDVFDDLGEPGYAAVMRPMLEHVRRSAVRGDPRRVGRQHLGLLVRFDSWWNAGDPAPGEIAFSLLTLGVFYFIAYFGR